jgi:hypothetical protein
MRVECPKLINRSSKNCRSANLSEEVLMSLSRKIAFVGAIVSVFACNDLAAPPSPPVGYTLANINGRPLPTFVSPIPESPTILSATLQLKATGLATLTEHRNQMAGGDIIFATNYTYTITGNEIQFDYDPPCPANALCAAPPKGTISGSRLTLVMYGANSGIVYDFHLITEGIIQ